MSIEKRTYADSAKAKAAMDELVSKGFKEVNASFAPDKVRVVVNAPFGEGASAAEILDSHGPLSGADEEGANEGAGPTGGLAAKIKDPAAPLSSLLGWPVLTNAKSPFWPEQLIDDPAPLSNWLGWPILLGLTAGARRAPVAAPPESAAKAEDSPVSAPKAQEGFPGAPAAKGREGSPGKGQTNPPS